VSARAAALALDPWDPGGVSTVVARRRTSVDEPRAARRTLVGAAVLAAAVAGSVFVAARPAVHHVPDLRGMPFGAAARALHEHGLDEFTKTYVDDPGTERGTVLDQDPGPGADAEDGDVVTLELASGSVRLRSAGLLGDGYVEAAREVVELGLVPRREQVTRADGAGTVVDVGPAGRLTLGSLVTLTVAVGPQPAPAPATAVAPVPAAVSAPPASSPAHRGTASTPAHAKQAKQKAPQRHGAKGHGPKDGKHGKKHGKK
jgi:beta-lactam-binding protein with PASTA domain